MLPMHLFKEIKNLNLNRVFIISVEKIKGQNIVFHL